MPVEFRMGAEQEDEGSGWRKRDMVTPPEALRIQKRTYAWQDMFLN